MYSTSWKLNSIPQPSPIRFLCQGCCPCPKPGPPEKTKHIVDMDIVQYISNREDHFCGNFKVYSARSPSGDTACSGAWE